MSLRTKNGKLSCCQVSTSKIFMSPLDPLYFRKNISKLHIKICDDFKIYGSSYPIIMPIPLLSDGLQGKCYIGSHKLYMWDAKVFHFPGSGKYYIRSRNSHMQTRSHYGLKILVHGISKSGSLKSNLNIQSDRDMHKPHVTRFHWGYI